MNQGQDGASLANVSRSPGRWRVLPVLLVCAFLDACSAARDEVPAAPASASQTRLRVMAFNIEWGGTHVSFDKVVEAIRRADPDVVAIQEAEGNLQRLASQLGWQHDLRNHVISPHPLLDPSGADGRYVLVEVEPGQVVAVANVHLPSDPYGENWIADGRAVEDVTDLERRVRLPAIQPLLAVLPGLAADGFPVFLAGDFNSPSHRDWLPDAILRWPNRRYVVEWPVATAIEEAAFRDSYRQRHPDPLEHPGFTWWAGRPGIPDYNPGPEDSWQSRIDFIWYAGPAEVQQSTLVGESSAPGVTIDVNPWPSDHRAVLSDFIVETKPMPLLVAAARRVYRDGEPVVIDYNNRSPDGSILILPASGARSGSVAVRIAAASVRDRLSLPEPLPATGRYEVVLTDSQGRMVSENEFRVLPADARPVIEAGSDSYLQGEALVLSWRNAPGNRWDWVVVYPEDHTDREAYVAWRHVDARIDGEMALGAEHASADWPLAPGRYVAYLLADDGYERLAESAPFVIRRSD